MDHSIFVEVRSPARPHNTGHDGREHNVRSWSDLRCGPEVGVRVLGVWMVSWDHRDSIHHLRGGLEGDHIFWYESVQECGFGRFP